MNADCHWIESRLEDFLRDAVDASARQEVQSHIAGCESCRREVESFRKVDQLVAAYFRQQVTRTGRPPGVSFRPMRAAAALAGAGALVLTIWVGQVGVGGGEPAAEPAGSERTVSVAPADEATVEKSAAADEADRAKPAPAGRLEAESAADVSRPAPPAAPPEDAAFYVVDAGGYFHTLGDFSDSILVIGVLSGSTSGSEAFAQAYARYASTPGLRFLGVSPSPETRPEDAPFPLMLNRGSSLLETPAGQFAIVTPDGAVHARGPLDDSLIDAIASSIQEILDR